MPEKAKNLTAVFREVRTCFNQLKTLAERLHADLAVNPSMRAVMESLADGQPRTVPAIAANKGVSRQHIQTIMNSLLAADLVEASANPAHKRSPHFTLTAQGRSTFATIQAREQAPLQRVAAAVADEQLQRARIALHALNHLLAIEIAKGEINDRSTQT